MIFYLRWARPSSRPGAHTATPTVAACVAAGWRVVGADPRYDSVLMRRDDDPQETGNTLSREVA